MVARVVLLYGEMGWAGGIQGRPSMLLEDVERAEAVLAGGVDVAADVEAVLGDVVAGQAPADHLLGFQGADAALREVVGGPDGRVRGEAEHVGLAGPAELKHLAAGLLLHGGLRAGDAGHRGQGDRDGAAELPLKGLADLCRDDGEALFAGGVPGTDQAAQRPFGPAAASRSRDRSRRSPQNP